MHALDEFCEHSKPAGGAILLALNNVLSSNDRTQGGNHGKGVSFTKYIQTRVWQRSRAAEVGSICRAPKVAAVHQIFDCVDFTGLTRKWRPACVDITHLRQRSSLPQRSHQRQAARVKTVHVVSVLGLFTSAVAYQAVYQQRP